MITFVCLTALLECSLTMGNVKIALDLVVNVTILAHNVLYVHHPYYYSLKNNNHSNLAISLAITNIG